MSADRSLEQLRQEYRRGALDEADVPANPFDLFNDWFRQAQQADLPEPNAMIVATVSAEGQPSCRTVLLKGYGPDGFRFYSNYASRKGHDLDANPWVALLFYWAELERQVRTEGTAARGLSGGVGTVFPWPPTWQPDQRPRVPPDAGVAGPGGDGRDVRANRADLCGPGHPAAGRLGAATWSPRLGSSSGRAGPAAGMTVSPSGEAVRICGKKSVWRRKVVSVGSLGPPMLTVAHDHSQLIDHQI